MKLTGGHIMSKKPVLVVMAAGMGSRYGGLKQIDPVGNCGEAILDFSLYDAHEAGFETAVIIIKEAIKKDFMETVGKQEGAFVADDADDETFKIGDLTIILKSKGFWLIALLCLCFYSAVFPFLKYATSLMINKYNVDPTLAGFLPSILPFGNLLMTPIFGGIYDKYGKGATIMVIGSVLLIIVHLLFAMPLLNYWWFAALIMVLLGVAFSLVPSAMWPSVPKIIPLRLLGSAYALIFWVQNIGLGSVPLLIGNVLSDYCIVGTVVRDGNEVIQYDYTIPMLIFAVFGVIALGLALWLKYEDGKKGYGLEKPNIAK